MAVSFLALGTLTEIPQKTRRLLAILAIKTRLLAEIRESHFNFSEWDNHKQ
jgi:hypothetical protein